MSTSTTSYQMESLFRGVKALVRSLPTEDERNELLKTLSGLAEFIEELRSIVDSIPTLESNRELAEGMSRLDALADRAGRDNGLRKLLGLRNQRKTAKTKNGNAKAVVSVDERASRLRARVMEADSADIEAVIERSGEPLSVLTPLAASLGIRTRSKERKPELIKRIATQIENARGYALLRGDSHELELSRRP